MKIELILKLFKNFKIKKKKKKVVIEILESKIQINFQIKFKIHKKNKIELNKEGIDFQIFLLQVTPHSLKIAFLKKINKFMTILKILWTRTLTLNLNLINTRTKKKKRNKNNK